MGALTASSCKNLTTRALKTKLDYTIRTHLLDGKEFVPEQATRSVKKWLSALDLSAVERTIAWRMLDGLLTTYERRFKLMRDELDRSVNKL